MSDPESIAMSLPAKLLTIFAVGMLVGGGICGVTGYSSGLAAFTGLILFVVSLLGFAISLVIAIVLMIVRASRR